MLESPTPARIEQTSAWLGVFRDSRLPGMVKVSSRSLAESADVVDALATALAEARAEGRRQGLEWQPIETAPKDEDPILVCDDRLASGFHQVVSWEPDPRAPGYSWATSDGIGFYETAFTHWMPLPAPPPLATAPAETQTPQATEHGDASL